MNFPLSFGRTAFLFLLSLSFLLASAQEPFVRRSVVEEFAGTWCGHCPRGMVGMERLAEQFGDRFIGIAVHTGSGEPMAIPGYPDVQEQLLPGSGAPSCVINRLAFKFDPYSGSGKRGAFHYGIDEDFAASLAMPTEAKVELKAQWDDEFQWDVRFTATTTFNIDSSNAPYRLIFVLTEDGLTGTGDKWEQTNYFSLETASSEGEKYLDDDLAFWRSSPYHVPGVTYNHVPVNTLGVKSGIEGSIKVPIVSFEPQTYTNVVTTLASHTQRLIQDKNRLTAIAMLINTESGEVVNAAKSTIRPYGAADAVRGDANGDGTVDVADISAIITIMATATTPDASATTIPDASASGPADVNGDGVIDVADISAVITIMASATIPDASASGSTDVIIKTM